MKSRVSIIIILVLIAAVSLLLFQNISLKKKVDESTAEKNEVKTVVPNITPTKPANPENESPFDKPNVDPAAGHFKPPPKPGARTTTIQFEQLLYDFGRIKEGETPKAKFTFTNTGSLPLDIENVQPACGCTVAQWPQERIMPGEKGTVVLIFNSKGFEGERTKSAAVVANTDPRITTLSIKATVLPIDK
jgi:hypothetical protein